ncbi:MAG: amino acid permease [Bacteroidia bacterium]|nr:amino acid permease [Bacteroidia bacterium]
MTANIKQSFKRSLSLFDSTAIVAGSMIGSGIFIVSTEMSRTLGSPGWLLIAWIITGILTIFAVLSYGELACLMPKAGGQYVYLREAYNPFCAFLYGWTAFLVIQTGIIAAVAMAFAKFLGVLIPWVSPDNVWYDIGFVKLNTTHLVAIVCLIFLSWLNTRGIKAGKYVQNTFTIIKTAALLGLIIIGIFVAKNIMAVEFNKEIFWDAIKITGNGNFIQLTGFALIVAIGTSMVGSLFAADSWYDITFAAQEVKKPEKNLPLSMLMGTLIVITLYVLANFAYLQVLPLRGSAQGATVFEKGMQFPTDDRLATAAMSIVFGEYAAIIMAVFIIISTFGCNNGIILSGARVFYAMANDGLFFKGIGKLNKNGVPGAALTAQCIWACVLCLSGTYHQLLDYVIFAVLLFFVLTILGVFILRIKWRNVERPYKAFGYPVIPAIYILTSLFIMIILLVYKPAYTWPGLIIVAIGIPVYFLWKAANKKSKTVIPPEIK